MKEKLNYIFKIGILIVITIMVCARMKVEAFADSASVSINAKIICNGKTWDKSKDVVLTKEDGTVIEQKNAEDGNISFSINYSDTDFDTSEKVYNYKISIDSAGTTYGGWTYDSNVYDVNVTLPARSAEGNSSASATVVYSQGGSSVSEIVFQNTYLAVGNATIPVHVTCNGTTSSYSDKVNIELLDASGNVIEMKEAIVPSDLSFSINFDQDDV